MNCFALKRVYALAWMVFTPLLAFTGCQTGSTNTFLGDNFVIKVSGQPGNTFSGEVSSGGKSLPVSGSVPMDLDFKTYRLECWFDVNGTGPVRFDVYKNQRLLGNVEATGPEGSCHIIVQGDSMMGMNSASKSKR
jgi:hypothetical protein